MQGHRRSRDLESGLAKQLLWSGQSGTLYNIVTVNETGTVIVGLVGQGATPMRDLTDSSNCRFFLTLLI